MEVRVRAEAGTGPGADGVRTAGAPPEGLRLELVDPGPEEPAADAGSGATGSAGNTATHAPVGGPRAGDARPGRTGSGGTGSGGAAPGRAGIGGTGSGGAVPGRAGSSGAGSGRTGSGSTGSGRTDSGGTGSGGAVPGRTGSGGAGSDGAGTGGGRGDGALGTAAGAASAVDGASAPLGTTAIPALTREQTERKLGETRATQGAQATQGTQATPGTPNGGRRAAGAGHGQRVEPYIGPRPRIVTRRGWGADEWLRERRFVYTKKVKAAFVHHTASGNDYRCSQAPSLIRGIYRYHVRSMGWRDIGYNFLVDKCGNIYEGRAGGVTKPVLGAHTLGFNSNSMGIAVLGSFGSKKPSASAVRAVSRLTAWKLGLYGMNPRGKTYLTSAGSGLYRKGRKVRLHVISGHRDGFATECPGRKLYGKLGSARTAAARYQGR
ncbi:MAG TPA: N-acetylmuramoyl-L-alanine amidase [Streptomyces sp.]|nr:N-acetylmuramoyl-L-alanine amidase [Streptomyces sp.]